MVLSSSSRTSGPCQAYSREPTLSREGAGHMPEPKRGDGCASIEHMQPAGKNMHASTHSLQECVGSRILIRLHIYRFHRRHRPNASSWEQNLMREHSEPGCTGPLHDSGSISTHTGIQPVEREYFTLPPATQGSIPNEFIRTERSYASSTSNPSMGGI